MKNTLIIEEIYNENDKLYIEFSDGMKEAFAIFINSKNEKRVKYNQKIVDLIINYDSYIQQYTISFGANMRKKMDRAYKELLKNNKVKYEL